MKAELTVHETIEMGAYDARVKSVEDVEGQFGPQVKFVFELVGGDYDGQTLWGWCSATYSTQSKLYDWTKAILFGGNAPPLGHILNTNDFVGRPVRIGVSVVKKDDKEFNKISGVTAPRQGNGRPAARPQKPAPDVVEFDDIPGAARQHASKQPPPPPAFEDDGAYSDELQF